MRGYQKLLLGTLCGLVMLAGCGEKDTQSQQQNMVIPVSSYTIKKQNTPVSFEYPTQLISPQRVEVFARVEGTLLKQNFIEGEVVKEGDKLFKIDPARYQANVNIAKAQLLSAQATFKEAKRDWDRSKKLFEQKALSPKERDQSLSAYENAEASVANAKANLDNALIDLGYTDVVATTTGKTSLTNYDLGNLVGSATNNNALVTITQLDPIHAEFSIPSNDYYFLRTLNQENIKISYILPNGQVYDKLGKLDFIDSVIDGSTATIKARAIVENKESLLVPGEFSRVRIEGLVAENTITIPQVALLQDAQGSYVYKVVDGKATQARVVLGNSVGNTFIIQSGLQEGDVIITNQLVKLRPGAPVSVANNQAQ